jgi:acyl carrier protein
MKEIWQKYLGIEPMGVNDNFFQLGGDSLKGMIMLSHVQKELGMKIGISEFFQNPTIRELAKWTEQGAGAREEFSAIPPVEKKEYYVLSSAQKRLFTLQKLNPELINYNENFAVIIEGKLDKESIEQAFGHLIQRHESLRTSFHMQGEEPVQGIHDVVEFAIEYYDIGNRQQAIGNKEEPMPGPIIKDFIRPFDLSRAPLLRVGLLKTTGTKYILMVDMHHIITDGASQEILINDFLHLYQGNELPGLAIHYKDYSQWLNSESRQKTIKTQEAYWLKEFAAPAPVLNLPTDSPRPSLQSFEGNTCSFTIAREDTKKIKKLTAQYEVTLYMVFLALINVLMSKLSGNEDIIVGTVISGRIHAHLQKMVGMFVNVLCMRNSPCKDKTFREFLKEVKERTLQAFQNQDYQFEDLVEKTGGRRDPSRHPVFDIGFEFQGNDWSREMEENLKVRIPNFTIKSYSYKKKISRIDMIFFGRDARDQLYFHIEYCTKLFKEDTISNFIKYFKTILSLVLEEPGKKISDLDIIPAEEIQKIKDQLQEKNKEINIEFDL